MYNSGYHNPLTPFSLLPLNLKMSLASLLVISDLYINGLVPKEEEKRKNKLLVQFKVGTSLNKVGPR